MDKIRQSLVMSGEQWRELSQLAILTNSIAKAGVNVGKPSWRKLVKRIASEGEVVVDATGKSLVIQLNQNKESEIEMTDSMEKDVPE